LGTRGVPVDFWYGFSAGSKWRKSKIAVLGDPQGAAFAIFEGETDE
jgi:hypothetical protein